MVAGDEHADYLVDLLSIDDNQRNSPVAFCETAVGLCRSSALPINNAKAAVKALLIAHDREIEASLERKRGPTLDAYTNYSKGWHPAALYVPIASHMLVSGAITRRCSAKATVSPKQISLDRRRSMTDCQAGSTQRAAI